MATPLSASGVGVHPDGPIRVCERESHCRGWVRGRKEDPFFQTTLLRDDYFPDQIRPAGVETLPCDPIVIRRRALSFATNRFTVPPARRFSVRK